MAVCHGGPGTIMDAREAGHVPLCVPRDPKLGEHVDDHQQRFAAMVGQAGVVRHVASVESFHEELDLALALWPAPRAAGETTRVRDTARAKVAAELDDLLAMRVQRRPRRRQTA